MWLIYLFSSSVPQARGAGGFPRKSPPRTVNDEVGFGERRSKKGLLCFHLFSTAWYMPCVHSCEHSECS